MSKFAKGQYTCAGCGREQEITVYETVDVSTEPELKGKIADKSLFFQTCSNCGQPVTMNYPFLYEDTARKLHIYLLWDEEKSIQDDGDFEEGAVVRVVRSIHALNDKINIFDYDLSDKIMELTKFTLKLSAGRNDPEMKDSSLYFGGIEEDGSMIFAVAPPTGPVKLAKADRGIYDKIESQRAFDREEIPGEFEIDELWAANQMMRIYEGLEKK